MKDSIISLHAKSQSIGHYSYYWHMYSNFSHCLGYLAKTSQFWIIGIHGIWWHHACKPYEPAQERGGSSSWPFCCEWILTRSINWGILSLSLPLHKPIESFHSGFAAELNYPPTQSVAETKKPLLPATPGAPYVDSPSITKGLKALTG